MGGCSASSYAHRVGPEGTDKAAPWQTPISEMCEEQAGRRMKAGEGKDGQHHVHHRKPKDPQAKLRAEQKLAARLKLEYPSGWSHHLQYLALKFKLAGYIDRTEMRSVTLGDLQKTFAYAKDATRRKQPLWLRGDGSEVTEHTMNLHNLRDWLLLPATCAGNCSFLELLTSTALKPTWYVSHSWDDPTKNFVTGVEAHSAIRQLSPDTGYWVCAFANRLWDMETEILEDPAASSFMKALELSSGILLVLDREGNPFKRLWCVYETYAGLKKNLLLDVASAIQDWHASILTDGPTELEKRCPSHGTQLKLLRELCFPTEVIKSGLKTDIESALVFAQADRRHILNKVAGRSNTSLHETPTTEHPNYKAVDSRFASFLARAAWVQSVVSGRTSKLGLPAALAADQALEEISLDLSGVPICSLPRFIRILKDVGRALPGNLKRLSLKLSPVVIPEHDAEREGGESKIAMALDNLLSTPQLEELALDFTPCPMLTNLELATLGVCLSGFPQLLRLELHLADCRKLGDQGLAGLGLGLRKLPRLQHLRLNLAKCRLLGDEGLAALAHALGSAKTLLLLSLNFATCELLSDKALAALSCNLCKLLALQELQLSFEKCHQLTDVGVGDLGSSLSKLLALQQLHLKFAGCQQLGVAGVAALGAGAGHSKSLKQLLLDFSGCTRLGRWAELIEANRHSAIAEALGKLPTQAAAPRKVFEDFDPQSFGHTAFHRLCREQEQAGNKEGAAPRRLLQTEPADHVEQISDSGGLSFTGNFTEAEGPWAECLGLALSQCYFLAELDLQLKDCPQPVLQHFGRLEKLERLHLDFKRAEDLNNKQIQELRTAVSRLGNLKQLCLDFSWCTKLTDHGAKLVGRTVGKLRNLNHLKVNFAHCEKIGQEGIQSLGAKVLELRDLHHLDLNFLRCDGGKCQELFATVAALRSYMPKFRRSADSTETEELT